MMLLRHEVMKKISTSLKACLPASKPDDNENNIHHICVPDTAMRLCNLKPSYNILLVKKLTKQLFICPAYAVNIDIRQVKAY